MYKKDMVNNHSLERIVDYNWTNKKAKKNKKPINKVNLASKILALSSVAGVSAMYGPKVWNFFANLPEEIQNGIQLASDSKGIIGAGIGLTGLAGYYALKTPKRRKRAKKVAKGIGKGIKKSAKWLYQTGNFLTTKTGGRFLLTAGLTVLMLYAPIKNNFFENKNVENSKNKIENVYNSNINLTIDSIDDKNDKINDLYSIYLTGKSQKIDLDNIVMNTAQFKQNMKNMWEIKRNKSSEDTRSNINNVIENQVKEYLNSEPTKMNLNEYLRLVENKIAEVNNNLNWEKISNFYMMNETELNILKKIGGNIDALDLTSYSLTELMPTSNAKLNMAIFDDILENAGKEFVYLIPAMNDGYTSFGPYQLTYFALGEIRKKDGSLGDIKGASKINQALPENYKIPGSMIYLKGDDHHKAGYMFALHNVVALLKSLNDNQIKILSKNYKSHEEDFLSYISVAHHRPKDAKESAIKWIQDGMKKDYVQYLKKQELVNYANKTQSNRKELKNMYGP